jgi:S-phase kinase-associated protein 1
LTDVAKLSKLVETTIDDNNNEDQEIPLHTIKTNVLAKVIEYCEHYKNVEVMNPIQTPFKSEILSELVQGWYADFVAVDQTLLFDLVTASNFLDIKPLLDLACLGVSIYIKGKSPEDIRKIFNISNEFQGHEDDSRE